MYSDKEALYVKLKCRSLPVHLFFRGVVELLSSDRHGEHNSGFGRKKSLNE